ncbi:P-loop containing nucleoside triphosphate hydrolase protein [Schizophyllum amplum]|uniref:P-loop containing nucleoside triphosphate hydrolase protein n=1 Tax=Schizophyllum amplum TaxID=97359 RepID=A0A550C1H2_9AGAR|nr:P-loop containing nucleoside triphosphate hydrolase protein [Auriculariopsis ampla]
MLASPQVYCALSRGARPASSLTASLVSVGLRSLSTSACFPRYPVHSATRNLILARPTAHIPPRSLPSLYRQSPLTLRPFSLKALWSKGEQPPPPHVVARISLLEAEANTKPRDVGKQLELFRELAQTNMKASYEIIVSRWERMCEVDSESPLLQSSEAFKIYLDALVNSGNAAAVQSAVERRDALLTAQGITPPPVDMPALEKSEDAQADAPPAPQPTVTIEKPTAAKVTESQGIAQAVLAKASTSNALTGNTMSRLWGNAAPDASAPIQVILTEKKGAWVPRLLRFMFLSLLASFFLLIILSVFFENSGLIKAGPQFSVFEPNPDRPVRFSDVHGVDEAKEELQDIVQFLKDPSSFTVLGGRLPNGVLLTGPPGTGKTMLAKAVAGEAGVPFFSASGSEFDEMYVGVGAKRVRELFAAARKRQPAIIFIDELDAVGGKRNNRDQQYMKQTLNQLLVEMDGFQGSEGVIVIAATNFPQSLDSALTRPGRFDRHIAVPLPDIRGRVQIIQHHMKGVKTSTEVDPKRLARGTIGFSGADLQNMVNIAAIHAAKERAKDVNLNHFEWAIDRIIMGAERKSAFIEPKQKLATAYHEAGHALVCIYTDGAMPLHKVTCMPRGHALGYTSQLPQDDKFSVTYKEMLARMDVAMGGRIAEGLIYGPENITGGASSDIHSASGLARDMVKRLGFSKLGPVDYSDSDASPKRLQEIDDEVTRLIKESEERAREVLTSKLPELHRLAESLVEYETLDGDEVKKVIKGEPIRALNEVLDEKLQETEEVDNFASR